MMPPPLHDMTPAQKGAAVLRAECLAAEGVSTRRAAEMVGLPVATLARWRADLEAAGGDVFAAFAPAVRTGRPVSMDISGDLVEVARWHRLTKGSLSLAVHFFAKDARCPAPLAAKLRAIEERALSAGREPSYPPSIRRAFHVTAAEKARFRGRKATQAHEMTSRRGLWWIDEEGAEHDLLPGQLWEADDYSANQPYVWIDENSEMHLGRQVLACMDVYTAGWLGFDHIGRERDAYRGEDILRFLGRNFRAHGLPLILRLERGSWESDFVHGIEVDGMTGRWGGLDAVVKIQHVWKSKAKGTIEGSFNALQSWLGHTGRDVGRVRGEFEEAQKAWRKARKAGADPLALGFLSQEKSGEMHEEAARQMNARPRTRAALGERVSSDDLRARHGWHTTPYPEAEAWRLLPYKERRIVSGGVVEGLAAAQRGWPVHRFVVNQEGLHLENGHAVLVAYDPANPGAGCYVANADTGPRNRHGWPVGKFLTLAPADVQAPQINLSGRHHASLDRRKVASAGASTSFRGIAAAGRAGTREISLASTDGSRAGTAGNLPPIPVGRETTAARELAARAAAESGLAGLGRGTAPRAGEDRAAALRRAQADADALLL